MQYRAMQYRHYDMNALTSSQLYVSLALVVYLSSIPVIDKNYNVKYKEKVITTVSAVTYKVKTTT